MIQARPVPKNLKTISLVLAVVGFGIFIAGAAMGENRAWQAFHVNWLYFTIPSSAAVMFAAVQRITTARWSRGVIRLIEGFVAFLPVAFVLLLVLFTLALSIVMRPRTHDMPRELSSLPAGQPHSDRAGQPHPGAPATPS